ncbi:MAG: response regulator [Candidatus Paceibacterota bacterium]
MEKNSNAIGRIPINDINAIFKMMMKNVGTDNAEDVIYLFKKGLLRAQFNHPCGWYEKNGIIYFTLPPTQGITGHEWINIFGDKKLSFSGGVAKSLLSPSFIPTSGIVYEMAIITPKFFKSHEVPVTNYFLKAKELGFENSNLETACLFRANDLADHFEHWGVWATFFMDSPIIDNPINKLWYFIPRGGKERVFDVDIIKKEKVFYTGAAFISRKMQLIPSSTDRSSPKRILFVDDSESMHNIFKATCEANEMNVEIISAFSADDFHREWDKDKHFDVVLMDGSLKKTIASCDTVPLVKKIRETSTVPIIAISGNDSWNGLLLDAGCNYSFNKDPNLSDLIRIIRTICA